MSDTVDLAAEYLLLVLDDNKGGFRQDLTTVDFTVAAAELVDLVAEGALVLVGGPVGNRTFRSGEHEPGDPTRAEIVGGAIGKNYDQAITSLAGPFAMHPRTARSLRHYELQRLVAAGILRAEHERLLGLIPRTRYPQADGTTEVLLRNRMRGVLQGGEPDDDSRALIALLYAGRGLAKAFPDMDPKALRARGRQIAEMSWEDEGLAMALAEHAAYMAQMSAAGAGF